VRLLPLFPLSASIAHPKKIRSGAIYPIDTSALGIIMISAHAIVVMLLLGLPSFVDSVRSCCQQLPMHGFVTFAPPDSTTLTAELREPTSVVGKTDSFRFLSFNAPNLLRIETNSADSVRLPSRDEIWDIVCSIQQMGGKIRHGP
jgi:hypothetical protein